MKRFLIPFMLLMVVLIGLTIIFPTAAVAGSSPFLAMAITRVSNSSPRKLGTLTYAAGETLALVPANGLRLSRYKGFIIEFSGSVAKTGSSSAGTLATESPANAVSEIRLSGKSANIIKAPPRFIRQLNHLYLRGKDWTNASPAAANGTEAISFTLYVDNQTLQSDLPNGSILDLSRGVQNPSLEIVCSQFTDVIYGGNYTGTPAITGTFTISGIEDNDPMFDSMAFSDKELTFVERAFNAAATSDAAFDIPLKRTALRLMCGQWTTSPTTLITTLAPTTSFARIEINGKPWWGPYSIGQIMEWNKADAKLALSTGYFCIDPLRERRKLMDWLDLTHVLDGKDPDRITSAQLVIDSIASVANAKFGMLVESLVPPHLQKAS